jgi:hypothetical protein
MELDSGSRRSGALLVVGAGLTAAVAAGVQALVIPTTDVSDKAWSYPWSPGTLVPVSLGYAVLHLVVLAGLRGFIRSGVTGSGRAARTGGSLLLAGTALLAVGELASIPVRNDKMDTTSAGAVGAVFGIAILLSVIGLFVVSGTTARAWQGWRRWTPLAAGIATSPLLVLSTTHYLATGVALYGVGLAVIGLALVTDGANVTSPDAKARALTA